jgi:hypothetical protein
MQALSPRLRALSIGLSVAVLVAMAGPAGAREDAQIKRIKKTLVGIESVIAGAERERAALGPATWTLERKIAELQGNVHVGVFVQLIELQAGRQAAFARMAELDALIDALRRKRTEVIADLQEVVQERIASKDIKQAVASWSSEGTLITYSADWEAVAMCESTGRWHIDARFDGGLQFDPPTWIGFGGAAFARHAFDASKKEQITIAERVLAIQGPQAWPNCFTPLSTL